MKVLSVTAFLLMSSCNIALGQFADPADKINDQNEILNSISDISSAYTSRDAAPFERIYLEDFVFIRDKPVYNFREQLMAMMQADSVIIRARRRPEFDTLSYESEKPLIRFYGPVAILNIAKKNYWQYRDQKCLTRTQGTEVWVRRNDGWKIAAVQVTSAHCDPKPYHPLHHAVAAIQPRIKPPVSTDRESEQQVRELINSLVRSRITPGHRLEETLDRSIAKDFLATNPKGEVVADRSMIESMPAYSSGRTVGLRNHDDAVVIYDNAAVYTYKIRPAAAASTEAPQRCSIIFAKLDGRWIIVGAHINRYSFE